MTRRRTWAARAARGVLGALFVVAGALKLLDPAAFAQDIANYRLLPTAWVGPVALFLPGIEVVAGLAVLTGVALRGGLVVLEAMLALFIVALVHAIRRGLDTSCGCFGLTGEASPVGWTEVWRNVALMVAGLVAWPAAEAGKRPGSAASDSDRPPA